MLRLWKKAFSDNLTLSPQTTRPATAAVLGIVPGLGQLYNGQFLKAFNYSECAAFNFILLYVLVFKDSIVKHIELCAADAHNALALQYLFWKLEIAPATLPILILLLSMLVLHSVRDSFITAKRRSLRTNSTRSAIELRDVIGFSLIVHKITFLAISVLVLMIHPQDPGVSYAFIFEPNVSSHTQSQSSAENARPLKPSTNRHSGTLSSRSHKATSSVKQRATVRSNNSSEQAPPDHLMQHAAVPFASNYYVSNWLLASSALGRPGRSTTVRADFMIVALIITLSRRCGRVGKRKSDHGLDLAESETLAG